ncbi:hypothetical protein MDA_GLEAN10011298 [Myotis davidii]|uniref:Uncharacterized protein n=1 Tax=Myotis davidii TaxID=225400 RepID=L5MFW6_MYODS|nr:hypothetical protein MDA_GLEAN10011298 [Myotis davidii]
MRPEFFLYCSQDLMQDMKMYWPDLLHPSPNSTFLCMLQKLGILPSGGNYYQVSDSSFFPLRRTHGAQHMPVRVQALQGLRGAPRPPFLPHSGS